MPATRSTSALASRPRPLGSLTAAASRIQNAKIGRNLRGSLYSKDVEAWQEDAWDMYDLVGEMRFLAVTLAGRLSQARFFVGKLPSNPTDEIERCKDNEKPAEVFRAMVDRPAAFTQLVYRMAVNLFIPGEAWLVGTPDTGLGNEENPDNPFDNLWQFPLPGSEDDADSNKPVRDHFLNEGVDVDDLTWRVCSNEELVVEDKEVTIKLDPNNPEKYNEDDVYLIRVWRPHPRKYNEPDSPTRSSLPVLRELVGLTMSISAQIDSRLSGAGLLLVPDTARKAVAQAAAKAGVDLADDRDPFTEALIQAMVTPITDRASAAAVVPLVMGVPDESIEFFRFMEFGDREDHGEHTKREESIRRLALGMDCPPELLLGVGSMNHWGAWLVKEDVVTTHLEPPLALICDALSTEYLWPVLVDLGMDPDEARTYVVWYDVEHLIVRPSKAEDALALHKVGALTDESLRDASGFDESDAPEESDSDPAMKLVIRMVTKTPTLAANPGIENLYISVQRMLAGLAVEDMDPETPGVQEKPVEDSIPSSEGPPSESGRNDIPSDSPQE